MNMSSQQLIAQLKALADPIRLRIVSLCAQGECSVSELTQVMGQSQPRISQHLKRLCDSGMLERFRDGHFVYYRVPLRGAEAAIRRNLLALLPDNEPQFERDSRQLGDLRSASGVALPPEQDDDALRELHRALVELTVTAALGDLIDVGSGRGHLLKLLASRARRAVGVDIDADARQLARAELMLAGVDNCSLRMGDMYALPFEDAEFDTAILDDVLSDAEQPLAALHEAHRLLKPGGRLFILAACNDTDVDQIEARFAEWCQASNLRLASPRRIPREEPSWLLAVATPADQKTAAA
jgi:ArsR family transcriptional regulator